MKFTSTILHLCVLCGIFLTGAHAISGNARIVDAYEHQSVVKVKTPSGECTGTLIAPGVVLTAQHCLLYSDKEIRSTKVYLPALPGEKEETKVGITHVVRYDDFKLRSHMSFEEIVEAKKYMGAQKEQDLQHIKELLDPKCHCAEVWEYKGNEYYGCDARAPDSDGKKWCFTKGKCGNMDGGTTKFCESTETLFSSLWNAGELLVKALKALIFDSSRGELFTLYRGDIALLFLDQCIVDRKPVDIDIEEENDYTCEIVENVGYGWTNSAGVWGSTLGGGTGGIRNVGSARAAPLHVLSPQACMMSDTYIYVDYLMEKYFSDPTKWHYAFKPYIERMLKAQHNMLANGEHGLRLQDKPVVCVTPTDERMQLPNSGDSGGPIFREDGVQVGVNSHTGGWRFMGLSSGITAYFGKVSYYSDWILENVATSNCGSGLRRRRLRDHRHFPFKSRRLSVGNQIQKAYGLTKESAFGIVEKMKRMDQCQIICDAYIC